MSNPERLPDKEAPMETILHSPVELNDLIVNQEDLLAGDPDSFDYQLSLGALEARWKMLFGVERIPLSYVDISSDDVVQLLGTVGPATLRRTSGSINVAAVERKWPLEALEVSRQTDPEINDEKSVLVRLRLRTSDKDEEILESFGFLNRSSLDPGIQEIADDLFGAERALTSGISFDVELVAPPEPQE